MTKAQEPRTSHMCVMFATGRGSIITLLRQTSKNFSPPPSLLASRVRVRRSLAALLTSLRGVGHLLGSGGGRNRNEPCTGPRARTRWEGLTMQAGSVSDPPMFVASHYGVSRTTYDLSVCVSVRLLVRGMVPLHGYNGRDGIEGALARPPAWRCTLHTCA